MENPPQPETNTAPEPETFVEPVAAATPSAESTTYRSLDELNNPGEEYADVVADEPHQANPNAGTELELYTGPKTEAKPEPEGEVIDAELMTDEEYNTQRAAHKREIRQQEAEARDEQDRQAFNRRIGSAAVMSAMLSSDRANKYFASIMPYVRAKAEDGRRGKATTMKPALDKEINAPEVQAEKHSAHEKTFAEQKANALKALDAVANKTVELAEVREEAAASNEEDPTLIRDIQAIMHDKGTIFGDEKIDNIFMLRRKIDNFYRAKRRELMEASGKKPLSLKSLRVLRRQQQLALDIFAGLDLGSFRNNAA